MINKEVSHILELTTEGKSFASYGLLNSYGSFDFDRVSPVPEELPDFLSEEESAFLAKYQEGSLRNYSEAWKQKAETLIALFQRYHSFSKEEWRVQNGREHTLKVYTGKSVVTFSTREASPPSSVLFLKRLGALCKDACFHYTAEFGRDSYFECEIRRGKLFDPIVYRSKDKRDAYMEQEIRNSFQKEMVSSK